MNRLLFWRAPLALGIVAVLLAVGGAVLFAAAEKKTSRAIVETPDAISMRKVGTEWVTVYTNATITQEEAKFTAANIEQKSEKKDVHVFTCTGNPTYTAPESTITADKLVAFTSPRSADFTGNVKAVHTSKKEEKGGKLLGNGVTTVTSQRLTYDYARKWADFSGGRVTMVNTPTGNGAKLTDVKKEIAKEPSTLTCDKLSYDYANKKAFATGSVYIVQKEREIWADQGTYDEATSLVVLKGNVKMKNSGKEELKNVENADTVTISLENDWLDMRPLPGQKLVITIEVEDDESTNNGGKK